VMQKIGMTLAGEFDHPKIESGHPLQRHVVYAAFTSSGAVFG
jgi:hypothetical protein